VINATKGGKDLKPPTK